MLPPSMSYTWGGHPSHSEVRIVNDLPIVLFVIAIILLIVTLVGHGIWVLLAAIFGGGRKKPTQTCPFCRRSTPLDRDRCDWCGKDLASPMARELSDLDVVRRQLQRFREKGTLTPQVADRLLRQLQDYRQQLLQPAAARRAAPIAAAVILEEAEKGQSSAAPSALPPAVPRPEAVRPAVPQTPVPVHPPAPRPEPAEPPIDSQLAAQSAAFHATAMTPPHGPPV